MNKGKLGIVRTTYSVVAFVLALAGQLLLCGLLVGFVLLYEKDEFTSRQCMTAFFLSIATTVFGSVGFGVLGTGTNIANIFSNLYYGLGFGVMTFFGVLFGLCLLVLFIFGIIGLVNVAKQKEAGVPLFSTFAYKAFGFMKPKPQIQPPPAAFNPAYQQNYQPGYGQPPAAPGSAPGQPPMGQPQPPAGQYGAPPQGAAPAAPPMSGQQPAPPPPVPTYAPAYTAQQEAPAASPPVPPAAQAPGEGNAEEPPADPFYSNFTKE